MTLSYRQVWHVLSPLWTLVIRDNFLLDGFLFFSFSFRFFLLLCFFFRNGVSWVMEIAFYFPFLLFVFFFITWTIYLIHFVYLSVQCYVPPSKRGRKRSKKDIDVYVCVYICIYVHVYVCMYVRTQACIYVCINVCVNICMYVCVPTYTCSYLCMYVWTATST